MLEKPLLDASNDDLPTLASYVTHYHWMHPTLEAVV